MLNNFEFDIHLSQDFAVRPDATFTFKSGACSNSEIEFADYVFNFSWKFAGIAFAHAPVSMSTFWRTSFSNLEGK